MPDCIVIGAGASACANAPLISDFQQKAELVAEGMPENFGHGGAALYKATVGYWIKRFRHLNIEEFYVMAELQQILAAPNPIPNAGDLGLADCVQAMIAKTLAARMKGPPCDAHARLATRVRKRGDTVVTLNWDLSLDNAFLREKVGVGLGYDQAYDMATGAKILDTAPRMLKLHGSLNWWHCEEAHLIVQQNQKSVADAWDAPPPICPRPECQSQQGKLIPLMVPPTSQKLMATKHASVLRPIWKQAYSTLSSSKNVVFAGYSFPSTDVQFRTFVQRALLENPNLEQVSVVTNRKFGSEKTRFEDHYGAILQPLPGHIKIDFDYDGFEAWARR